MSKGTSFCAFPTNTETVTHFTGTYSAEVQSLSLTSRGAVSVNCCRKTWSAL